MAITILAMLAALIIRSVNLNYNSPFNDEAIYVVVGKEGLFEGDWTTRVPFEWVAGIPLFYPSLAAIGYKLGGIVGARFLNILIFGLTLGVVHQIAYQLTSGSRETKLRAGLFAVIVLGGSSVSFMVSRLATYDMPSFLFAALTGLFLILATRSKKHYHGHYSMAAACLVLSFCFKYVTVFYVPVYCLLALLAVIKNRAKLIACILNFILTAGLAFTIIGLLNLNGFLVYYRDNVATEVKTSYQAVWDLFVREANLVLLLTAVGAFGMLIKKKFTHLFVLLLVSSAIIIYHLFNMRTHTFDKHVLLSVIGYSIIAGMGLNYWFESVNNKPGRVFIGICILLLFSVAGLHSFKEFPRYNTAWVNDNPVTEYLQKTSSNGDQILSETGDSSTLALHDITRNLNTFNYISYKDLEGEEALAAAVSQGYYDAIVLQSQNDGKVEEHYVLTDIATTNLNPEYKICYQDGHFTVYKKTCPQN